MSAEWGQQFEDHLKRVKDIAKTLHEYCKDDTQFYDKELSNLRNLVMKSEEIKSEADKMNTIVSQVINQVNDIEDLENVNIQSIYEEVVANGVVEACSANIVDDFDMFVSSLQQDGDVSLIMTQQNSVPLVDPWTKKPIVNPVKSKTCGHVYDMASVKVVLSQRKEFRCPNVGCKSRCTGDDLEEG